MSDQAPSRNAKQEFHAYINKIERLARLANLTGPNAVAHPMFANLAELRRLLTGVVTAKGLNFGPFPADPHKILHMNRQVISSLAVYGLDRMHWLADGYFDELERNQRTISFIKSRLPVAEHYWSIVAELQTWGYLKARGLSPNLVEEDGLPDLEFSGDYNDCSFHFDVKLIGAKSKLSAVDRHIKKANKQIKNVGGEAKGGCYLKIAGIGVGDSSRGFPPKRVVEISERIQRLMKSGNNKSVAKTIVVWDEIQCVGNVPGWQTWIVTRRSQLFEHENAVQKFEFPRSALPASTVATNVFIGEEWPTPRWDIKTTSGEISVTER